MLGEILLLSTSKSQTRNSYISEIDMHTYLRPNHRHQIQIYPKQVFFVKFPTYLPPKYRLIIDFYWKQICTHIIIQTIVTKFIYIGNRYAHMSTIKPQTTNSNILEIDMLHLMSHMSTFKPQTPNSYISKAGILCEISNISTS